MAPFLSFGSDAIVAATIGGVSAPVYDPSRPEKLPFLSDSLFPPNLLETSQTALDHLRWMMVHCSISFYSGVDSKKMLWDKTYCYWGLQV